MRLEGEISVETADFEVMVYAGTLGCITDATYIFEIDNPLVDLAT